MGDRRVSRLAPAATLVVVAGISWGLDTAMVVALSLAVMEIDGCNS